MHIKNPDIQIVKPNRLKVLGWFFLLSLLMIWGIGMISVGEWLGWIIVGFFIVPTLVCAGILLPNSSYLKISHEGFITRTVYRTHSYQWSDTEEFYVEKTEGGEIVVFNFSSSYKGCEKLKRLAIKSAGYTGALPPLSMPAVQLAHLLNEYREKYRQAVR
jgi:hypothetical protein